MAVDVKESWLEFCWAYYLPKMITIQWFVVFPICLSCMSVVSDELSTVPRRHALQAPVERNSRSNQAH